MSWKPSDYYGKRFVTDKREYIIDSGGVVEGIDAKVVEIAGLEENVWGLLKLENYTGVELPPAYKLCAERMISLYGKQPAVGLQLIVRMEQDRDLGPKQRVLVTDIVREIVDYSKE
ncbi:hypothetical protein KY330_00430 [Candidatus Woesearchaeota archaeon]|nr:hypothetical protein [Candidatus Woesearchaeota archaeon]